MFSSCLNPQRVFNASLGQYIIAACGRCEYCRESRRKVWARRLELHAQSSPYVLFFTLTYSNEHLPKVYYDENGIVTDFEYSSERVVYNRHTCTYSQTQKIIHSDEFNGLNVFQKTSDGVIKPPHYVSRRLNDASRTPIFDNTNSFAISYGKDFQNFIKRCRVNLGRYFDGTSYDPSFTYFGVSEYGPKTFRPHFHGLLFFHTYPTDVDAVLRLLTKSWSKSPCSKIGKEFTPVVDKIGSAKYVSKYVCKDTTLPLVLLAPEFATHSFKSISIPLGSESFDISDIPAIFSKGTLLYDSQYYDKEAGTFVTIKNAYPSCAWHRVFPKLLGRRLLSPSLLRSCFDRIFKYRTNPDKLPNLTKKFSQKYPYKLYTHLLDDGVVDDFIKRYRGYSDPFEFPNIHNYDINKRIESATHSKLATYSYFFNRLLSTDLDFFLFGIPQNLTFCRKVLANCNRYDFLSSSSSYLEYYLRYELIHLTDTLKYTHEDFEELPTPYEFASIYTDFYTSLYPCITDYDTEQVTRLDLILSNFGLSLPMFYDGIDKITIDFDFARDMEGYRLRQQEQVRRTNALYLSQTYEDL